MPSNSLKELKINVCYIIPIDPAVKPTTRKNINSSRSLGKEFTIRFNWVIWPCAPQVKKFFKNIANNFFSWGKFALFFLFSKELGRIFIRSKVCWWSNTKEFRV